MNGIAYPLIPGSWGEWNGSLDVPASIAISLTGGGWSGTGNVPYRMIPITQNTFLQVGTGWTRYIANARMCRLNDDNTFSYGTTVTFYTRTFTGSNSNPASEVTAVAVSPTKVVAVAQEISSSFTAGWLRFRVLNIAGLTITLGASTYSDASFIWEALDGNINTGFGIGAMVPTFEPSNGFLFVAPRMSTHYVWGLAGTVSGDVITLGTPTRVGSTLSSASMAVKVEDNKVLLYHDNLGAAVNNSVFKLVTVAGTTLTTGSDYNLNDAELIAERGLARVDNNNFIYMRRRNTTNDVLDSVVNISGASINFGPTAVITTGVAPDHGERNNVVCSDNKNVFNYFDDASGVTASLKRSMVDGLNISQTGSIVQKTFDGSYYGPMWAFPLDEKRFTTLHYSSSGDTMGQVILAP